MEFRDSYPADVVRRQVVDRGRRALVVYGQGHLQRRQVASNYDMSTWQAQTVVSLLERDTGTRVFNIWTWLDREVALPDVSSWPVPSLAVLKDTTLGERDFGTYARGLLGGNRFAVQDGRLVPLPRDQWRMMRMDDQFDALLYLGSPSTMTFVGMPASLCRDQEFVRERLRRFTLAGPPPELANFKKACGLPCKHRPRQLLALDIIPACGSPSMPGSCMTSASAPTSGTSCGSSRASIATRTTSCSAAQADLDVAAQLGPNFRTVLEPSPNYSLREQFHVPWVLRRERPDVFHAPHYVLPPASAAARW